MKPVFAAGAAILALAAAAPAAAALAVGDAAPEFSAPGTQGGTTMTIVLSELLKRGPVVLYFIPSAFTGGSEESREFADHLDQFRAAGASVVGMSRDSVDTLARFSTEQCAGRFPLASASERIVNGFDVNDGAMFNTRTTYVIDTSGKIAFVHDDDDHAGHVARALAFVQGLKQ